LSLAILVKYPLSLAFVVEISMLVSLLEIIETLLEREG
jgi:hypothetical protein